MTTIVKFDKQSLEAALKAISKATIRNRDQIQEVAVWAVATSIMNGDVSVANMLFETLGSTKSLRKDSLAAYFERYGNLVWDKADKKFGFCPNARHGITDGVLTSEYEATIVGNRWDDAKRESEVVSVYDMEKQFRIFLGKMEKLALEPANTIENRDVLFALTNTFNKIVAEKTLRTMTVDQTVLDATAAQQAAFDARQPPLPVIVPAMAVAA